MSIRRTLYKRVKVLLFSSINGELVVFLFFLALSGVFWLLMTLNETYEKEFKVPVRIVNVPENVVLTSSEYDSVRVTLKDKGLILVAYMYGDEIKPINLNFKTYVKDSTGHCLISVAEINRLIYQQLSASTKIVQTKNDRVELFYNYGQSKKVPVKWSGKVVPEHLYFISNVDYYPDSVTVYASQPLLDSVSVALTMPLDVANFRDTLSVNCNLRRTRGIKFVPDNVRIRFMTDVLTEESIDDIPVTGINVPKGKVLRTFPSKVSVRFVTGVSQFRYLSKDDFVVVADYEEIMSDQSEKCRIYLRSVPNAVSRASLNVTAVDYLIEDE